MGNVFDISSDTGVKLFFDDYYMSAADEERGTALGGYFHDVTINDKPSEYKGLAATALPLAKKVAENANRDLLDGQYHDITVEKADRLRVAIYGDGEKLGEVPIGVDFQYTDYYNTVMPNGDPLVKLENYDWDDFEKLEATMGIQTSGQEDDFTSAVECIPAEEDGQAL